MSSDHIEITGNGRLNGMLRAYIDHLQRTQELSAKMKKIMNSVAKDSDYEALRDKLQFPQDTDGTADATAIYNLIVGVDADLNTANINSLTGRGG